MNEQYTEFITNEQNKLKHTDENRIPYSPSGCEDGAQFVGVGDHQICNDLRWLSFRNENVGRYNDKAPAYKFTVVLRARRLAV